MHAVHHASRPPTAWAAMSFHPYEALTGRMISLVFLVPIHVAMLGVVIAVMTVMGVNSHMGWEMFPRRLVHQVRRLADNGQPSPTPSRRVSMQLRTVFPLWDRLCGTDRGLSPNA